MQFLNSCNFLNLAKRKEFTKSNINCYEQSLLFAKHN